MSEEPRRPHLPGGRLLADVLTFGWVLPASIGAGAGLGWLLDKLFGTFPVFTVAIGLLGVASGLVQVYRQMTRIAGGDEGGPKPPPGSA